LQGVALQNSNNQANTNFYGQLNRAKSANYRSINAIRNISGISNSTANRYINQGINEVDQIAANYACTPGAITNKAINTFAANVNASKNSVNKQISSVKANKTSQYNQYHKHILEHLQGSRQGAGRRHKHIQKQYPHWLIYLAGLRTCRTICLTS